MRKTINRIEITPILASLEYQKFSFMGNSEEYNTLLSIQNMRGLIVELDKLILEEQNTERIEEFKELRDKLASIVHDYDNREKQE